MLGDPAGAITNNFGVMIAEGQGLADPRHLRGGPGTAIIQAVEDHTTEGIGRDAADLLRKIKAAQYVASHPGEVCPAKWQEGDEDAGALPRSRRQDLIGPRSTPIRP